VVVVWGVVNTRMESILDRLEKIVQELVQDHDRAEKEHHEMRGSSGWKI